MRISITQTPSNTPSNSATITPSLTDCPTNTPTMTPTRTIPATPSNTATNTPTNTPTRTIPATPTMTNTQTITPTITSSPTMTPTQTITPTCETFTTQYMESAQQGNKDIRFTLFDNPDFTGNANAICDYTITGTYDIDGGAINQPYTTIMVNNDHNHTYDTGFNITGFTITSVVPACPCVLVIFSQITPTPSATPTLTPTLTQTTTQTNTPSFTPTNTATPSITPTTPEECPCNCWSLTYASGEMPADLEVRYRDCQLDTVQTQSILSLETIDNLDGTYTANICVQTGGTYNTPVCVSGSTEITCDPFMWIQGGVCCIPADCAIECCLIDILTNNSLDVEIDGVDVDGSPATLVGGVMPNVPGNGTTLCSTITGTVDIRISYSAGVSGQKITLCDSNGTCTCQNITGSGPGIFDFLDVVFDCITPITILAEDGTC